MQAGMHVEQSGVSSTAGGLGLEIGKNFGAGNIYTRVGVNHAFSGTVKTAYTSGATTKYTSEDIKGTWTDLAFGGRYGSMQITVSSLILAQVYLATIKLVGL